MIDHVSVPVRNLARATAFYDAVLIPLGMSRLVTRERTAGYGKRYPEFWVNVREDFPLTSDPARTLPFAPKPKMQCEIFMKPHCRTAAVTTARRGQDKVK